MLDVVDNNKLFRAASPEELEALRRSTQIREYAPDQQIFAEGDEGDGVYLIRSGSVRISAMVNPEERRVLARLGPGDFFGEMAVLDDERRSAAVIAEVETVTGFIPRGALLAVLESSPQLAVNMVREFSLRLRDFNRRYIREMLEAERLALVGRFARSVVHDFKNPLGVIRLSAEMAARSTATGEAREISRKRICKQVDRLSNMINELLDFTQGSQNPIVLASAHYPAYIRLVMEDLAPELEEKRVALVCEMEPPDTMVLLDPTRLTRVFFNLVNNAVDAMPNGGQVILRFRAEEGEMITEIEDTGPGIAPEILSRMFEPFATHGKTQGTGLGLSICRRIIEDHRGRIFARTEAGHGAIFVFTLPLANR